MSKECQSTSDADKPTQPPLNSEGRAVADDIIIFTLSREPQRTLFLKDLEFRLSQLIVDPQETIESYLRENQDSEIGPQVYTADMKDDFVDRVTYLIWQVQNR